jgi:hypothetical protein
MLSGVTPQVWKWFGSTWRNWSPPATANRSGAVRRCTIAEHAEAVGPSAIGRVARGYGAGLVAARAHPAESESGCVDADRPETLGVAAIAELPVFVSSPTIGDSISRHATGVPLAPRSPRGTRAYGSTWLNRCFRLRALGWNGFT